MSTSISSAILSKSMSEKVSAGISNSAAATLRSNSSSQSDESTRGTAPCRVRCLATSATSGKKVWAISWANENLSRPLGRFGLYSIRTPLLLTGPSSGATVRASNWSSRGTIGIESISASSNGSKGGPFQPASRAARTAARARRTIEPTGFSDPNREMTEPLLQVLFAPDIDTRQP